MTTAATPVENLPNAAELRAMADSVNQRKAEAEEAKTMEQVRAVIAKCKVAAEAGTFQTTFTDCVLSPAALGKLRTEYDLDIVDRTSGEDEGRFYMYEISFAARAAK